MKMFKIKPMRFLPGLVFAVLVVSIFAVGSFALPLTRGDDSEFRVLDHLEPNLADHLSTKEACVQQNNFMECEITPKGCHHRTCTDGKWTSYSPFLKESVSGKYECLENKHGGGERCIFVRETSFVNIIFGGRERFPSGFIDR